MEKAEVFGFSSSSSSAATSASIPRVASREIGAAVTRAVVVSLILILILDFFVTKVLQ